MYFGLTKRLRILFLQLVGCIAFVAPVTSLAICAVNEFQVTEMEPLPKYRLTGDPEDRRQLTDGCTNRYPLWLHRDSVGWAGQTPITLHLRLLSAQSSQARVSGQIGFHTAKGKHAGVHIPRRIDLYALEEGGQYRHVGAKTIAHVEAKDQENHWIRVPVESKSTEFVAVLHATGNFLMLDEINWTNEAGGDVQVEKKMVGTKEQVLKDSLSRLKRSFSKRKRKDKNLVKLRTSTSGSGITAWVQNPWGSHEELPTAEKMLAADEGICVSGIHSEKESSSIGLLNTEESRQIVKVSLKGEGVLGDIITIGKLGSVLAANGAQVFDPIVALDDGNLELSAGGREYLWVTFDLGRLKPGKHDYQLEIEGEGEKTTTTINYRVQVLPAFEHNPDEPRAVVWSYLNDIPVKNNPQLALEDLSAHGVNVFVIHPSNIPQPGKGQDWSSTPVRKFHRAVKHYAGHGLILLYLGWPNRLGDIGNKRLSRQKKIIKEWVAKLDMQMTIIGLSNDEWALYPIDEPHGADLDVLKNVVAWVKEVDKEIRIYANPINTTSGKTTIADLRLLNSNIDYWQPDIRFAKGVGRKFFSELEKPWWIYGNPKPPAKSVKPIEYRRIAWNAWSLGASGIGFWAYSDTSDSSAWDDFDGKRPDWSVVYEYDTGPVTSRRWEAFREGIEDHRLLNYVLGNKNGIGNSGRTPRAEKLRSEIVAHMAEQELDIVALRSFRSRLLDMLVSQTGED